MKYIIGNWKMNLAPKAGAALAGELCSKLSKREDVYVGVAPPFITLPAVISAAAGTSLHVGAQNCHWAQSGAFTGEVAPGMLVELGCQFVIIGHSERRSLFAETLESAADRAKAAYAAGLMVCFCIGESLTEREGGETNAVLARQMAPLFKVLPELSGDKLILAYEPVWAIGTGKVASLEQIDAAHCFIRDLCLAKIKHAPAILYGGSVTPENAKEILAIPSVAGSLVGGASLVAEKFGRIWNAA